MAAGVLVEGGVQLGGGKARRHDGLPAKQQQQQDNTLFVVAEFVSALNNSLLTPNIIACCTGWGQCQAGMDWGRNGPRPYCYSSPAKNVMGKPDNAIAVTAASVSKRCHC
jgi:hypothetical protein